MSVPAQHQVSTRHKLKSRTKELNINEPENLDTHSNTLTFDLHPFLPLLVEELIRALILSLLKT